MLPALQLLLISAAAFGGLALLIKGHEAVAGFRRAAREVRVNLSLDIC